VAASWIVAPSAMISATRTSCGVSVSVAVQGLPGLGIRAPVVDDLKLDPDPPQTQEPGMPS